MRGSANSQNMIDRIKCRLGHLNLKFFISFIILTYSVILLFIHYISGHPVQSHLFNADALYLPILFENILKNDGNINDWYLTPAPYFFPDYIAFLMIYYLGENFYQKIAIYSCFQVILTFIAISFTARELACKNIFCAAALATVILIYLSLNTGEPYILVLISAHHYGAFLVEIISLNITIRYFRCKDTEQKSRMIFYLCCLSFITTASDSLFLIQFLIPLFASIFIFNLLIKQKLKENIYLYIFPIVFGIVGLLLCSLIIENRTMYPIMIGTEKIINNFIEVFKIIKNLFIKSPTFSFYFSVFYLFCFLYIFTPLRKGLSFGFPKEIFYVKIFLLSSAGITLSTVLLTTNLPVTARYFIPAFSWPVIIGVVISTYIIKNKFFYLGSAVSIVIITLLSFNALDLIKNNGISKNHYPHEISCIDTYLFQEQLNNGIAQYWDAKYIQAFSKANITLAQHFGNLEEHRWITSKNFFRLTYDFAIISKNADPTYRISAEGLIKINGPPKKTINCGNKQLLIYGKDQMKVQ
ncbi:MAG: hypothetical protein KDJ28_02625 [Candidatus Competibacteraceae bacterium]|nr:hypothetical protein [Candidatus Competibacteraceae bacterium]